MGYTHYWYVKPHLNETKFTEAARDFKRLMPLFRSLGIQLAGPNGTKQPVILPNDISFNGLEKCGHKERDLGITWPADSARGVAQSVGKEGNDEAVAGKVKTLAGKDGVLTTLVGNPFEWSLDDTDVQGTWFAGAKLNARTCGGDCSHESFNIGPRFEKAYKGQEAEKGFFFACCKTAYKPYDLAVNCALIILKHHLEDEIKVQSDGTLDQWSDALHIVQRALGYGKDFAFGGEGLAEVEK